MFITMSNDPEDRLFVGECDWEQEQLYGEPELVLDYLELGARVVEIWHDCRVSPLHGIYFN